MAFNYWQNLQSGGIYHIYNRSISKEKLFIDSQDYAFFLYKLQSYLLPYHDFYAYCLIPNHFHLLVEVKVLDESIKSRLLKENTRAAKKLEKAEISLNTFLEDQYRRLFSSYALYFNHRYKRNGALFQKRVKRVEITNDVKQLTLICYIHHNPIHHGILFNYQDWKYSSYHALLSKKKSSINREKVLKWFGSGNSVIGQSLFLEHHKNFKRPSAKTWMLD